MSYYGKTPNQRSQSSFKLKQFNKSSKDYQGQYCEIDGAYTDSGEGVYGYFYMNSDRYGDAVDVYTDSGESIYGDCFRSSGSYCEIDGAYTDSGEAVYGGCYIN